MDTDEGMVEENNDDDSDSGDDNVARRSGRLRCRPAMISSGSDVHFWKILARESGRAPGVDSHPPPQETRDRQSVNLIRDKQIYKRPAI